jgi:hypothetical protein
MPIENRSKANKLSTSILTLPGEEIQLAIRRILSDKFGIEVPGRT